MNSSQKNYAHLLLTTITILCFVMVGCNITSTPTSESQSLGTRTPSDTPVPDITLTCDADPGCNGGDLTRAPSATNTSTQTNTPTRINTSRPTNTPTPTVCATATGGVRYLILSGQTLSQLAVATGTTYQNLMRDNCMLTSDIIAGTYIRLPFTPVFTNTPTNTPSPTNTATNTPRPPTATNTPTDEPTPDLTLTCDADSGCNGGDIED